MRNALKASQAFRRVVFLTPDLHELGGIGAVARMVLERLQSHPQFSDCPGEVYSFWNPPETATASANGKWPRRYARGGKLRYLFWGLQAGLRDPGHTLVVCTHPHLTTAALPLAARGAQVAVIMHGTEVWLPLTKLRAIGMRRAHTLISVSKFTADRFRNTNPGFRDREIIICPLGAPPVAALPNGEPTMNQPFALIVGRLVSTERYKGHDDLLEIWPSLRQRVPDACLVVAGDGDDRQRLEIKARDLALNGCVRFLGRVDPKSLQQLYRDCAFFAMPSSGEGFGLVYLEAMRAGKACIGGQGAPAEVIEDGVTGFVIPSGQNHRALLEAMTQLFHDHSLERRMGQAGLRRFSEYFTESHFQARVVAALGLESDTPKPFQNHGLANA
jgi:phosphatidyl-myo-inositol dimannoside synthase